MGAPPAVGTARFSTATVPAAARVARWEAWNATALLGLRARPAAGTRFDAAQVAGRRLDVRWARVRASAHTVRRDGPDVAATPTGAVAVFLPQGPVSRVAAGTTTTFGRGELLVLDADRPFERAFPDGVDEFVVAVPRPAVGAPTEPVRCALTGLGAGPAAAALAADLLAGAEVVWRLGPRVQDLLHELAGVPRPVDHVGLARAFIAHRLTAPSLSAATIAATLEISERQLSRAFAAAGTTVPGAVLEQRLQQARTLLEAEPGVSPAAVARRVGIASPSWFSHRFTARFGTTPGRWGAG